MATAEDERSGSPAGNATTPAASSTPSTEPEGTEVPESTEEPEPTQEPDATVTAGDLSDYEEIDERTLAQIVKAPDDHIARQVVLYGRITQLDAATGKCFVRISVSHAAQDDWYDYEHNSVGFAGDGESDCPAGPLRRRRRGEAVGHDRRQPQLRHPDRWQHHGAHVSHPRDGAAVTPLVDSRRTTRGSACGHREPRVPLGAPEAAGLSDPAAGRRSPSPGPPRRGRGSGRRGGHPS